MVLGHTFKSFIALSICAIMTACSTLDTKENPALVPATPNDSPIEEPKVRAIDIFKPSTSTVKETDSEEETAQKKPSSAVKGNVVSSLLAKADRAMASQQWLRAQRNLEQAMRIEKNNPMILLKYGDLHRLMGTPEQARAMYKRAILFSKHDRNTRKKIEESLSNLP